MGNVFGCVLEYKEGAIQPATREHAERDLELYRGYVVKMLQELDEMKDSWLEDLKLGQEMSLVNDPA